MKADQQEQLLIACELFGANSFSYRVARRSSATMLRARVYYVQRLLDAVLTMILSSEEANPLYFSRGSGKFVLLVPAALIDLNKLAERINALNLRLLDLHKGDLQLIYALETIPHSSAEAGDNQQSAALASLKAKMRAKELEPFKSNLRALFSLPRHSSRDSGACQFCAAEDLLLAELSVEEKTGMACSLCRKMIDICRVENQQGSGDLQSFLFPAEKEITELPGGVLSAGRQLEILQSLSSPAQRHYEAALHAAFRLESGDLPFSKSQRPVAAGTDGLSLIEILAREYRKILAAQSAAGHNDSAAFFVEASDDNLIVLGKLPGLIDLSFALGKALDKELPQVCHSTGIVNAVQALPLSWLVRDAVHLSEQGWRQGSRYMSIGFAGAQELACFSWADWRGQVKPLGERIRHFDHLGVLGFGFWDYLLNFSRSRSTSIYPLMYRIARREESHSVLRKESGWQQFKAEILLALAGSSADAVHKRAILKTALSCFLLSRRNPPAKKQEIELALTERS